MRRFILVVAALLFIQQSAAAETLRPLRTKVQAVIIEGDQGGVVADYIDRYEKYAADKVPVKITGVCSSACTAVTLLPPEQICITLSARLAFHETRSATTGERSDYGNAFLMHAYPDWVQEWVKENNAFGKNWRVMGYKDLVKHYGVCEPERHATR